ncbi:hypothetical protein JW758_06410 [Candidatus Peregrinibacteria bacterium]|nr:hypothetical protein [Candidatus Peregrinibacteria bacterium]
MKTYNKDLYKLFNEIADLMGIMGEGFFRTRAYREGARVIMEEAEPITKKNASEQEFLKLPRIGGALSNKMMEYIKTDKIKFLEELRKEVPKSVRDMLKIPGIGPGRVRKLYFMSGINSKRELIKMAKTGELESLPGFGKKTIDKIILAIETDQQKKKKHKRSEVEPIAKKLINAIKKIKGVKKAEIAGSFRREAKLLGDLDMLVVGPKSVTKKTESVIKKIFPEHTMLASGDTKVSLIIAPEKLQIDVRFVPEESYGAALLYFTGSKEHNVMMRRVAIANGYLLNEYGLFKDGEYVAGESEKEIYDKLGIKYIKPKNRKS